MTLEAFDYAEGERVVYRGEPFNIIAVSLDQTKLVLGTERRTIMVSPEDVIKMG